MTWLCQCGLKNAGFSGICAGTNQKILDYSGKHEQVSNNVLGWLDFAILGVNMTEDEKKDLAIKYWNQELGLVANMSVDELRVHREELQAIAFESKMRLQAIDSHERDKRAKLSISQKEWIVTREPDETVSNAINVVNQRRGRMSKIDKLDMQLRAAGIDDSIRKEMLSKLEQNATDKSLKTVDFSVPKPEKVEKKVQVPTDDKPKLNVMGIKFNQ